MDKELLAGLKATCFGMYIGQKVMKWHVSQPPEDTEFTETVTGSMLDAYAHECYLQLRPLSAATEEECIQVAKLCGFEKPQVERMSDNWIIIRDMNNHKEGIHIKDGVFSYMQDVYTGGGWDVEQVYHSLPVSAYQYLQQQGIAMSVFYKGVPYSVEKLVDLGIIVLDK